VDALLDSARERALRLWPVLPAFALYALAAAAMSSFVTDDALITLRYARQWANGHGITWNSGEDPVEGFTNFSHVALGALALRLDLPALLCLRAFNVLSTFGLLLLTYDLARRAFDSRAWAAVAAVLVAIHPALSYWSVSGLETSAYACMLLLGIWALQTSKNGLACLAFLAASITRFEAPAAVVVAVAAHALFAPRAQRGPRIRALLPWAVVFCVAYGGYFAWRYSYFGYPLSNSAYYKARGSAAGVLVHEFAKQNAVLLALVPFAPFRRLGTLGWQLLGLLLVYVAGFYRVHPSVSYWHRFFLPVYAPAVLLAVAASWRLWRVPAPLRLTRYLSAALLAFVVAWDFGTPERLSRTFGGAENKGARMVQRARIAAFIAGRYPVATRVLAQDVGMVGYALLNPIDDAFGLNDEALTHRFSLKRAPYVHSLLAKQPDLIVLTSTAKDRLKPHYQTDRMIAMDPLFWHYRLVQSVVSTVDKYHYMIYARVDVPLRSKPIEIAIDPADSPGTLIEKVAQRSWRAQRSDLP
jgi:hypothetical protein